MKTVCSLILLILISTCVDASERRNGFNLYLGQMTTNHWDDFFRGQEINSKNSYLLAAALLRRIGGYKDLLSYELEGQVVKHFNLQEHWEFNALATLRWEKFFWDDWLDTSVAFGLGPSYATEKPAIEIENDGDSANFLLYWMLELAIVPYAKRPDIELITRIHHRSNAYGLAAEEGGSNALALGIRYRF